MKCPVLTIGIPTYNRAEMLEQLLLDLRNECAPFGSKVRISVLDNASTDLTSTALRSNADWAQFNFRTHAVNIGGVANILRLVELCETDWLWIFPDDCVPEPGVIARILKVVESTSPPILYLRCSSWEHSASTAILISEIFTVRPEVLLHMSWLPCLVMNRSFVLKHLPEAYRLGCYSYPHLVLAICSLRECRLGESIYVLEKCFRPSSRFTPKRYSWIQGAIYKFSETLFLTVKCARPGFLLRTIAFREKLGAQAMAAVWSEYSMITFPVMLSVLWRFGASMFPAAVVYTWMRLCPPRINRFIARGCLLFAHGRHGKFSHVARRYAMAVSGELGEGLAADF